MAARQKYPTTHAQLLALAVEARRDGLGFDAFWERAVRPGRPPITWRTPEKPLGAVIWPNDTADRALSRGATMDEVTRESWRRAYEGIPARPQDQALRMLAPLLDSLEMERAAEVSEAIAA